MRGSTDGISHRNSKTLCNVRIIYRAGYLLFLLVYGECGGFDAQHTVATETQHVLRGGRESEMETERERERDREKMQQHSGNACTCVYTIITAL